MSDLPSPLVDVVQPLTWFDLQEGPANVQKTITTITLAGSTTLPLSTTTLNDVYVNAPGLVTIVMPLEVNLAVGQQWVFKDISGQASTNVITIQPNSGENDIDNQTSFQINFNYGALTITWNGTSFSILT
jgi:hypothetical protein